MKVGVHDLIVRSKGKSNEETFNDTKKLVKYLDEIGYEKYWFAEHHGMENVLSSAPEILVSYFAAITENISLGTGGTMIMHYSPLKIAETFKTLAELAPGRVDIGLGRAPGGSFREIVALSDGNYDQNQDLYHKMDVILDYLKDKIPDDSLYSITKAVPMNNEKLVEPWMLGSTGNSARAASMMGLGYSFAKFFSMETPTEIFKKYKNEFRPSEFFEKPELSVSYKILVTETKEELEYLEKSFDYFNIQQRRGDYSGIIDPEELKNYQFSEAERNFLDEGYRKRYAIKGTKDEVRAILEEEIEKLGTDMIFAFTPLYSVEDRMKSYKLLKEILE